MTAMQLDVHHFIHFVDPAGPAALDRIERIVKQIRAQGEAILTNEQDAIAKLDAIGANIDEIAGDLEELKNRPDVTPAVASALDSLIERTRSVADVVPEPAAPAPDEPPAVDPAEPVA